MKIKTALFFIIILTQISAFAQTDTIFYYWNKDGKSCAKDTATSYGKMYLQNDKWVRKQFRVKNDLLYFEGMYLDKDLKLPHGEVTWYKDDGAKDNMSQYDSGRILNRTYYYANGSKKGFISYANQLQQGWDEQGNEIKNYVVERLPEFGKEWRNYIAANINTKVAFDADLNEGQYRVIVKFSIDKEGKITDVVATNVPARCPACGAEAIRVISNGPTFKPPILNNEVVIYKATQPVVFAMIDGEVKQSKKRSR